MTAHRRPRLPCTELPATWGKSRARTYAKLVRSYATCPDDDVVFVLVAMAALVDHAALSTRRDGTRYFTALKRWNKSRANQTDLVCPRCGEFRLKQFHAHSIRSIRFHIDAIVELQTAGAPLLSPCQEQPQPAMYFDCGTCGESWRNDDPNATVAFDPRHVPGMRPPEPQVDVDPKNLN